MVDRKDRDDLVTSINRYLGEEIAAFEFDDQIFAICHRTEDATVDDIVLALWCCYDDVKDHKVVASKPVWDFFQRALLLLQSDGEIEESRGSKWTIRQAIAGAALVLFGVAVLVVGIGYHLLLVCVPFGVASMVLSRWRAKIEAEQRKDSWRVVPFSSVAETLAVRRAVKGFSKSKYPEHLKDRRFRGRLLDITLPLQTSMMWLLFGPIVLLYQLLPEDCSQFRVVVP